MLSSQREVILTRGCEQQDCVICKIKTFFFRKIARFEQAMICVAAQVTFWPAFCREFAESQIKSYCRENYVFPTSDNVIGPKIRTNLNSSLFRFLLEENKSTYMKYRSISKRIHKADFWVPVEVFYLKSAKLGWEPRTAWWVLDPQLVCLLKL